MSRPLDRSGWESALRRGVLVLLCLAAGCSDEKTSLKTYPVRGSVVVNGEPAAGMVVTFQNTDKRAPGNAAHPVGVTDKDGKFALSTNSDKDGAPEGDYVVLFYWASSPGLSAYDRLGGRFNKIDTSKVRVTVEPKEMNLEPFRLDIGAKLIRPAENATTFPQ
jgi:hypothetical protein